MVGSLVAATPHRWRRRTGWILVAAAVIVLTMGLAWALTVVPRRLYPPLAEAELGQVSDPARRIELETGRLRLQADARAIMLQGLAGVGVLVGVIVAARQLRLGRQRLQHNFRASQDQLELSRNGQITERFTRAIDQLGKQEQLEVVLGGVYALERIAYDSPDDQAAIVEVLLAYVRTHAPWPPGRPGQYVAGAPLDQLPMLQLRAPDVQAILTVLGRAHFTLPLDLRSTDLRRADFTNANLQGAQLDGANLQGAQLNGAKLQDVRLNGVNLQAAQLNGANLERAQLNNANLERAQLNSANLIAVQLEHANLRGAQLEHANLRGAQLGWTNLRGVRLDGANLQGAQLARANLRVARLDGADLQAAWLVGANFRVACLDSADLQGAWLVGADLRAALLDGADLQMAVLGGAKLDGARLDGALLRGAWGDAATNWPDGFDPQAAGVLLSDGADYDRWRPRSAGRTARIYRR